jgi:hypothetical protein
MICLMEPDKPEHDYIHLFHISGTHLQTMMKNNLAIMGAVVMRNNL